MHDVHQVLLSVFSLQIDSYIYIDVISSKLMTCFYQILFLLKYYYDYHVVYGVIYIFLCSDFNISVVIGLQQFFCFLRCYNNSMYLHELILPIFFS